MKVWVGYECCPCSGSFPTRPALVSVRVEIPIAEKEKKTGNFKAFFSDVVVDLERGRFSPTKI